MIPKPERRLANCFDPYGKANIINRNYSSKFLKVMVQLLHLERIRSYQ